MGLIIWAAYRGCIPEFSKLNLDFATSYPEIVIGYYRFGLFGFGFGYFRFGFRVQKIVPKATADELRRPT
jgi:hypothetical protein